MPGRILQGKVIKNSSNKTISVRVERLIKHSKYKKYIRKSKNYLVHSEIDNIQIGSDVSIMESKPISKLKKWKLIKAD